MDIPLDQVSVELAGAVTTGTLILIQLLKGAYKTGWGAFKWVKGSEDFLAQLIPILLAVSAKLAGHLEGSDWLEVITWASGSGVVSGIAHDKVMNPVKGKIGGILGLLGRLFGGGSSTYGVLNLNVTLDDEPLAGAEIEIMFSGAGKASGVTDKAGRFSASYGESTKGATVRMLNQTRGEDIGEAANIEVTLAKGTTVHTFKINKGRK